MKPGFKEGDNQLKKEATQYLGRLVNACSNFFEEYQCLPMAETSAADAEQVTDNDFMAQLLGLRVAKKWNPKLKSFFSWKAAKGTGNSAVGGLVRTQNMPHHITPRGGRKRSLAVG